MTKNIVNLKMSFMKSLTPSQILERHILKTGVLSAALLGISWKYGNALVGGIGLIGATNTVVLGIIYPTLCKIARIGQLIGRILRLD
jgi:hypothetical protein